MGSGPATHRRARLMGFGRLHATALFGLAALASAAIWATHASSAGPSAGQLFAFGNNQSGQLGEAAPMNDPVPSLVAMPAAAGAVTEVAEGSDHTMAIGSDGNLYTFGNNSVGQLGRTSTPTSTPAAVSLSGASGPVVDAAAGNDFSLAVTASGQLYTFGDNTFGELGNGTGGGTRTTPDLATLPADAGRVTQVAAGQFAALAITDTDRIYSWGSNHDGQLGTSLNSGTSTPVTSPTRVIPDTHTGTFIEVAGGGFHSLALTSSGQVFSFGYNGFGQLGRSTATTPGGDAGLVAFPDLQGKIVRIAAGYEFSLAVSSTGQLYAFGFNGQGQLGNAGGESATPQLVTMPAAAGPIVSVFAGSNFSVALTSSGQLYGFGNNRYGQLASTVHNGTDDPTTPATLVNIPGAVNMEALPTGPIAPHTIVINAGLSVTGTALPAGVTGRAYSAGATATGGRPPYTWTASGLPSGLTIDRPTGQITGTPTAAGAYTPALSVTDARGITAAGSPPLPVSAPTATTTPTSSSTTTTPTTTTTSHSPKLTVSKVSVAGARATLIVACSGSARPRCSGSITATTIEHLVGGTLVAVTAAKTKPQGKAKKSVKTVKLVSRRFAVKSGHRARIAITLNKAGRKLLDHFYSVPVKLSITNSGERTTQKTTFRYGLIRAPIDYFWNYRRGYSFIGNLSAASLRRSWHVTLACQGGGCPLKRTALKIHGGKTSATAALKGAHLRSGAVVQLTISGANEVAEVLRFTIVPNALPRTTALCQTPDQHAPRACSR